MADEIPARPLGEELRNIPNILTLMRIFLIIPVVYLLAQDRPDTDLWAAGLFIAAALTDWLDGFLARRLNLVTLAGKLLDPLADKLLVLAALIACVEVGRLPAWFAIVLLSREIAITGLRSLASSQGLRLDVVSAGKIKTAAQLVGLAALIIYRPTPLPFREIGMIFLWISMFFSLWSAFFYFRSFAKAIAEKARAAAGA